MTGRVNRELLLWGLGVIQPASAEDLCLFLEAMYPDSGPMPSANLIEAELERFANLGWIICVYKKLALYSLREKANLRMPVSLRHERDKLRLVLMKSAKGARFGLSGEAEQELSGDSPDIDVSSNVKEVARSPDSAVSPLSRSRSIARPNGRVWWPRLLKQLDFPVGLKSVSPDPRLSYYSFPTLASVNKACVDDTVEKDLDVSGLATAIGISGRLLGFFMHQPTKHYRQFAIGKRGGGTRTINSPRLFLKMVQSWINDYLLWRLPQHDSSHAYRRGRSIITNADQHIQKRYVGNLDIEDFFGSVRQQAVKKLLRDNGFGYQLAYIISQITTLGNSLPQGAPTSPCISNAYLSDFDYRMAAICREAQLSYTRYADDISISGDSKERIDSVFREVSIQLERKSLRLNASKTRIASKGGQQRVAGVVVNTIAQPPRKLRRRIRAMFHRAQHSPELYQDKLELNKLAGYLSYLRSFPALREKNELESYDHILRELRNG